MMYHNVTMAVVICVVNADSGCRVRKFIPWLSREEQESLWSRQRLKRVIGVTRFFFDTCQICGNFPPPKMSECNDTKSFLTQHYIWKAILSDRN